MGRRKPLGPEVRCLTVVVEEGLMDRIREERNIQEYHLWAGQPLNSAFPFLREAFRDGPDQLNV